MKYLLIPLGIFIILVLGALTYCGSNINNLSHSILSGEYQAFEKYYENSKICTKSFEIYEHLPSILDGNYLVLLQNNYEIRPTGGFMGSYALVTFDKGVLKKWEINDIYTPDGQVEGHVPPPAPIQQAFKTGEWRLPNSNWEPSFPESAEDIIWFFEKAGIYEIDGIIALNFDFIKEWVGIIGEIQPLDFDEALNKDNFYYLTQSYSQDNFFPGSHAKKNYLSSTGGVLVTSTIESSPITKIKLINLIKKQLDEKQILVWHKDNKYLSLIKNEGWDGSLGEYDNDYFYSAESNLGSNKSNYCVERSISQDVIIKDSVKNKTNITFTNNKDECINSNVEKWMGEYANYQRVIIPESSIVESIQVNGNTYSLDNDIDPDNPPDFKTDQTYSTTQKGEFKEIGFWVFVPVQGSSTVLINYSLPKVNNSTYSIYVKRQPGIYRIPYYLTVNKKAVVDITLTTDELFEIDL